MDIKIVKLVSGETIVGKVNRGEKEVVKISSPAVLMTIPSEDGRMAMALMPWIPFSPDKEVKINKTQVLFIVNPTAALQNEYSTNFGSGVVVPDAAITSEILEGVN